MTDEEYKMGADVQRVKPYEGPDPYIFVSYAHLDYERIDPILRELAARGYRFWYDEGIDPGTEWPESIAKHLESSSVCLSFISPYSAASKNCRREINFALSRNITLLTIFLEDTKISPGLEMQISTYQSIMGYKYPDLPSLMERVESVGVMEPCRGPAGTAASSGKIPAQWAPAAPKKKRTTPLIAAAVLVLAAAAAIFWFRSGAGPKGVPDNTAESSETALPAESALPAATPCPTCPPDVQPPPTPEGDLPSYWTDHLWDEVPITAADPLPEGYRTLFFGEWEYGSLLVYGNEEGNIRFSLTDDRIPDGFPMSQTPGNNDPYWNVIFPLSAVDTLQVIIEKMNGTPTSFADLDTEVILLNKDDFIVYPRFLYSLTGNTLIFEIDLPEQFKTDDLVAASISLGTELRGYVDSYEFYN